MMDLWLFSGMKLRTKFDTINIQNTAQGIISFFNDSLNAERGKEICKVLHKNSLKSFEDIKSEVEKSYYS